MANGSSRPLSPHLQVYRWQITMVLSIHHRITGVALAVGTLLLTWWLLAAAAGPVAFATAQSLIGSPIGLLLLLGWTWSLFFHLANGIRHLVWDTGYGFEVSSIDLGGYMVVGAAAALTAATWFVGLSQSVK